MILPNILLFSTLFLLPGITLPVNIKSFYIFFLVSLLLDACCQVKEVGGVKYKLVKDRDIKPASTCKNDCVYEKLGSEGEYYCFRHGELSSECIEKEYGNGKQYGN